MTAKSVVATDFMDKPSQCAREALVEQILWLIRLRWIAVGGMILAALLASHVFGVLANVVPIYACAAALLISNILYGLAATKKPEQASPRDLVLGMIQVELDLLILTAVLHYSGGVVNPFFLFYIFHVIIAAIILPRNLSFCVGLTAILLFGLLEVNELSGGALLKGYHPLELSGTGGAWRNPAYGLGVFGAFACTVILTQYLTRMIITRMTAKELEAARNHDVLRAIINAMSEGLIFVTNEGNVAICNPAAKLWKRQNNGHEPGGSLEDFPAPLAKVLKRIVSSDDQAAPVDTSITFETSSPASYVEARSCPVVGIDGRKLGHVIVGQDLTKHNKLETDLRERTEELTRINEILKTSQLEMAQREKMVAIGQMATGIAHEIGNPLASISSVAQYLVRKFTVHEQKEHLLVIQYHVSRISNILKRMLSLSRPATSEYRWTDINELIENTLSLINFDRRAQSVAIRNIANPDLPTLWLNPQHFEQVFLNIFINALDAMDAKQNGQEHVLEITRELKDEMVEIRTTDTGIGMSAEVCRRAFDSFFTTKEVGKGTGLGLFISYNLVTEVDGTITLESEPDKGTTVVIRIPPRPKKNFMDGQDGRSPLNDRARAM